jgi:hypothetical protein
MKMVVQPLEIRTVRSTLMVVPCLDIRASLLPWDARLALQMRPLFLQLDLLSFLSCSLNKKNGSTTHNGCALLP